MVNFKGEFERKKSRANGMTTTNHTEPAYLDLPRLAEYSSLGLSTLRDHIRRGGLPAYKVKGKILIHRQEFDQWIQRFRVSKSQDLDSLVDEIIDDLKGKSDNPSVMQGK
ncbi:MAG: helix-turn-helix domain-containing protein [Desulfatiglandaceae bacterium]